MKANKRKPIMIFTGCEAECCSCSAIVQFENIQIESIVPKKRGLVMSLVEPLFCMKCGSYTPVITLRRDYGYNLTVRLTGVVK